MAAPSGGGKKRSSPMKGGRCCGVFLCRKAEAESLCSAFAKNVQRAPEGGRKKAAAVGRLFHLIEMIYLFLCFSEGGEGEASRIFCREMQAGSAPFSAAGGQDTAAGERGAAEPCAAAFSGPEGRKKH